MKFLCIDTSGEHLTVLIYSGGKVFEHFEEECKQTHSKKLMSAVEDILEKAALKLTDLDFLAVVTGPGSFTGIRIGIATIKALAFAANLKVVAVTAFDIMAYNVEKESALAIIDAGRDNFYICGYENKKAVLPPTYAPLDEVLRLSQKYSPLSFSKINGLNTQIMSKTGGLVAAVLADADNRLDRNSLKGLYIRKSQAEENR